MLKRLNFLCGLVLLTLLCHCKSSDLTKEQKHAADISILNTLMEQEAYAIDIEVVLPFTTAATQRVLNSLLLSRTGNNASRIDVSGDGHFITIENDSVKGNLPFFGERRLSSGPYGGQNGGIVFEGVSKSFEKTIDKKKRKLIIKFASSQNEESSENYNVTLNIFPNNNVTASINSTYKMFINYTGTLKPKKSI